jgi:chromosome segregation protein
LKNYQSNSVAKLNGCTLALDAIEKNDKYNQLFKLLLGHVFILEEGNNIHQYEVKDDQSLVVLSQNGNFLRQKYAIGGGSIGKFDGKRTGKFRNLEKLAEELRK